MNTKRDGYAIKTNQMFFRHLIVTFVFSLWMITVMIPHLVGSTTTTTRNSEVTLISQNNLRDETQDLFICAFNIQVFGVSKMSKPETVGHIIRILHRYDVVLIQEIRDISQTSIHQLLSLLNDYSNGTKVYQMELSERLGRTSSKEQYAYFYDQSKVVVMERYQFEDEEDWFERPPYSIIIQPNISSITTSSEQEREKLHQILQNRTLFFSGIHVQPSNAPLEIDRLVDVYESYVANQSIPEVWRNHAIKDRWVLMGDLNAGCSYVARSRWPSIRLRNQTIPNPFSPQGVHIPRFYWLIPDSADTTVAVSSCPYDRFVVPFPLSPIYLSHQIMSSISSSSTIRYSPFETRYVNDSAKVFYFNHAFGLTSEQTRDVSDHFPIEMKLSPFIVLQSEVVVQPGDDGRVSMAQKYAIPYHMMTYFVLTFFIIYIIDLFQSK